MLLSDSYKNYSSSCCNTVARISSLSLLLSIAIVLTRGTLVEVPSKLSLVIAMEVSNTEDLVSDLARELSWPKDFLSYDNAFVSGFVISRLRCTLLLALLVIFGLWQQGQIVRMFFHDSFISNVINFYLFFLTKRNRGVPKIGNASK